MTDGIIAPGQKLWFQHRRPQSGLRSAANYHAVRHMNIMLLGDAADRRAEKVVISFTDEGLCYVVEEAAQLRAIINKLEDSYKQLTGRGQSKVISFLNRQDWND